MSNLCNENSEEPSINAMTTDQKIDRILELVEKHNSDCDNSTILIKYEKKLKEEIKTFMLKNFNIAFIDDKIEANIYDLFLDELFSILNKFIGA